jgi:hypothetical protein
LALLAALADIDDVPAGGLMLRFITLAGLSSAAFFSGREVHLSQIRAGRPLRG